MIVNSSSLHQIQVHFPIRREKKQKNKWIQESMTVRILKNKYNTNTNLVSKPG
jgi:hypothetical protein